MIQTVSLMHINVYYIVLKNVILLYNDFNIMTCSVLRSETNLSMESRDVY